MSWKKIGGRSRTQNNYIVRTPQATIDNVYITEYLGSEQSTTQLESGLNISNGVSIIKNESSQVNPDRIYQPAELTLWNGTMYNSTNSMGEKIDSMRVYHNNAPTDVDEATEAEKNIVFILKPNVGGTQSFSGNTMQNKTLVGINNPKPYFELDVYGNARFNSARIGNGNGTNNNEPYDIIGKEIIAGSPQVSTEDVSGFPQFQPLLNYYGAGTIQITGYVYSLDNNENYKVDISLVSYSEFATQYKIIDNGSTSGVFDVLGFAVYEKSLYPPSVDTSAVPANYYYLEFRANSYVITKFDFNCPAMLYSNPSDNVKYFYEYPTSFNSNQNE